MAFWVPSKVVPALATVLALKPRITAEMTPNEKSVGFPADDGANQAERFSEPASVRMRVHPEAPTTPPVEVARSTIRLPDAGFEGLTAMNPVSGVPMPTRALALVAAAGLMKLSTTGATQMAPTPMTAP